MNAKKGNTLKKKPARKRITRKKPKISYKERSLKLLEKMEGIGEGIWKEDAQEYINRLRDNDRF